MQILRTHDGAQHAFGVGYPLQVSLHDVVGVSAQAGHVGSAISNGSQLIAQGSSGDSRQWPDHHRTDDPTGRRHGPVSALCGIPIAMRFTLDGESFDLTPEQVRSHLKGHHPENIREYWVDIDGQRWPVKQVIELATGARRPRFISTSARRWLQDVDFTVGSGGTVISRGAGPRVRTSAPDRSVDPTKLEEIDAVDVLVAFVWLGAGAVLLDTESLPQFPALPRLPGLYRMDFGLDGEAIRTFYVGEAVDLARRSRNYRQAKSDNSSQHTNRRIHKEIVSHLGGGGSIALAIATTVRWGDGEVLDLRLRSARRLAENAAVLLAQTQPGTRALNIDTELNGDADA
ncbi:MAG: hypothetical protein J0I40_10170 [Cellulomonas sp.]|nr:hypothetical protein [Cellulomonas sp.]